MASKEALLDGVEAPSLRSIAWHFLVLGATAFGGPPVHFGMFQETFVERLGWMTSTRFTELMAMSNCLPGPSSTQTAFAIGITQQGVLGGLLSGGMFIMPSAIIMTCLGFVSRSMQDDIEKPSSKANGAAIACSAVGVALVFIAVTQLLKKNVQGPKVGVICFATAALCVAVSPQPAWMNPVLILLGGLITAISPVESGSSIQDLPPTGKTGLSAGAAMAIFALYVVVAGFTIYADAAYPADWRLSFLTAGMFVWGGGPVVLPMLMTVLSPRWVPHTIFLTGIALAEMMPGPVFNLSCFLGVQIALNSDFPWLAGTAMAWAGLIGPGVVLIFGAVPLWAKLRSFEAYRRALPGLNAAAVGLLVSAVFTVYTALDQRSPWKEGSRAMAVCAYAAIEMLKVQVPYVVVVAAVAGVAWSCVVNA